MAKLALHIQAKIDNGGAMVHWVDPETKAVIGETFEISKVDLKKIKDLGTEIIDE